MINHRGFSILEMLVVIAIIGILAASGAPYYNQWRHREKLINARDELTSVLLEAQQLSTAAADSTTWGVHLETDSYTLFASTTYSAGDLHNRVWFFDGALIASPTTTFSNGVSVRGPDVIFAKFSGETNNTGTIRLISVANASTTQAIMVRSSGQIY